jgi:hypothetical protein
MLLSIATEGFGMIGRMFTHKQGILLFACLVAFSLLFGGFAHNIVPHEHGHSHEGEISLIWQNLHAALRHEGGEDMLLPIAYTFSLALSVVAFALVYFERASVHDPVRGVLLRRGIVAHRRFG